MAQLKKGSTVGGKRILDEDHLADDVQHITSTERTNWNGKQNALPVENRRKITFGTADPTGGSDGDIYFQYE